MVPQDILGHDQSIFLTFTIVILQKKHTMETFKGHQAGPNGCHLVPPEVFVLFIFIHFCYLLDSLAFVSRWF